MPVDKTLQEKFFADLDAAGNNSRDIAVAQGEYAAAVSSANMVYLMKFFESRFATIEEVQQIRHELDLLKQRVG